jgi:hypothetical protein
MRALGIPNNKDFYEVRRGLMGSLRSVNRSWGSKKLFQLLHIWSMGGYISLWKL